MNFKKIIILSIFILLLSSINFVFASDLNATDLNHENSLQLGVIEENSIQVSTQTSLKSSIDENFVNDSGQLSCDCVIYVGKNITEDGGNGSDNNPFSSLDIASQNLSDGKSNVTINIFDGDYKIGSELNFNVDNLIINGMGNVTIKKLYNDKTSLQTISLSSSTANITYNNIIFDATNWTKTLAMKFYPFYGSSTNHVIFNNCTFIGHPKSSFYNSNKISCTKFINCIFYYPGYNKPLISTTQSTIPINISWEYCAFYFPDFVSYSQGGLYSGLRYNDEGTLLQNIILKNVWFGQNDLPGYLTSGTLLSDGKRGPNYEFPISRYAQFSVSQIYLGNNQYEIVGKLTWNGTDDQDGMENFQPMVVNLQSSTGDINQTATLVNGTFRTIYTSSNSTHKVTAILDNEEIELEFTKVNITANPVSIYYGDDQNITFNFTQPITANVTVTVSNGSYNKTEKVEIIDKDSITYTVPDTLKEGIYNVEISLDGNNLFGSNSTTLTVSKVSDYTFNIDIQDNGNIKVGDDLVITVELPEDVSGNVTVKVNDNPEITKEATPNTVITINNLVGGNNNITIAYTGNEKYAAKTSEPQVVTAQKISVPDGDNALNITAPADSATPTYSINMPKDATGNLTVIVDGKDKYTKELVNGSATITLPELSAGKHDINVTYSGDAKYESISKTTSVNVPAKSTPAKKPVVKKAATKITAKKKTFKAKKKVKKYTITLKSGKKPVKKVWVTLKIKGKKLLKAKTNAKGKATFKIKKLTKKGKYKAVIKFKGNKNFKASSKKVKITIKK